MTPSDQQWHRSPVLTLVLRIFPAPRLYPSDKARTLPRRVGMRELRHKFPVDTAS